MSTDDQTDPRGVQRNRPETVDALASTVLSVLQGRQVVSFDGLRQFVLDRLVSSVLDKGAFSADALLVELRGYRLTMDSIIDQYVPTTARILGVHWVDDKISFAEVTIGIMRLQSLLAEASMGPPFAPAANDIQVHTLVLVPQGEQHFLGASVLACQLRRMGCDVDMSFDEDMGTLTERLLRCTPDMILLTCSRREILDRISDTVRTIRNVASQSPVLALGGAIKMDKDDVKDLTDVDIVTSTAADAIAFYTKRKMSRRTI